MGKPIAKNRRKKVMIIEDSEDTLFLLSYFLEQEFTVMKATNGKDALDMLLKASTLPDVIFLDLLMPVMDGQHFREMQQQNEKISSIPVVIMSAEKQIDTEAKNLDIHFYLKKPFDARKLLRLAHRYCNSSHSSPQIQSSL